MALSAAISAIEYYLPETALTNADLSAQFPEWPVEKIEEKTGIAERRIAAPEECSSDLAIAAAKKLFASGACAPADIDFVLLCTQSPDYFLPTTACVIQDRLGIPKTAGAMDFNLGCSGFVYGLGLAKGLIETGQAAKVLLITAETYSKFVSPGDKSVRTLFGDGAAATLVSATEGPVSIGPFVYGTDGSGAENLIVATGGMRNPRTAASAELTTDANGNTRSRDSLFMDGGELFSFTLAEVPRAVEAILARSGRTLDEIDLFVFHQANRYMLENLRRKVKIPPEKFLLHIRDCGNTVSSTIPIALKEAPIRSGQLLMLVGFGVGYSWASTLVRWA